MKADKVEKMINDIKQAVSILRAGGLVAIPTETVYGLGADATNPNALRKIFLIKQRPIDHPLIVHLGSPAEVTKWAQNVSPEAWSLINAFWPGPLTLVLQKAPHVHDLITGGQYTIGLRIPAHPIAQALLQEFGSGIAAPSANLFGRISPTTADAVREELGDAVDLILEGGQCEVGLESTIVDMRGAQPVILRPGMITATQIEAVLHQSVSAKKNNAPRVPGSVESHYAPVTPTYLMDTKELALFMENIKEQDMPFIVVGFTKKNISTVVMSSDPITYAHDLYQVLRELDKKNLRRIIIEAVPDIPEWDAIRDRLQRATYK